MQQPTVVRVHFEWGKNGQFGQENVQIARLPDDSYVSTFNAIFGSDNRLPGEMRMILPETGQPVRLHKLFSTLAQGAAVYASGDGSVLLLLHDDQRLNAPCRC